MRGPYHLAMSATNTSGAPGEGRWADLLRSGSEAVAHVGTRIALWAEDHREGIAELTSGLLVLALIYPRMAELRGRFQGSRWTYVLKRLDFLDSLALMMLLDGGTRGETGRPALDFVESALRGPDFLAQVGSQLRAAPMASPQRVQLEAGLGHFERREFEAAVPLLMVALEGAFTGEAERRALVRRSKTRMTYVTDKGRERNLGGADELFGLLDLEADLLAFLRRVVYGSRGNAFRHGVALEGHREKSLALVMATVAYLELVADPPGSNRLLGQAFARQELGQDLVARWVGLAASPVSHSPSAAA